jgi:hypothetical protein
MRIRQFALRALLVVAALAAAHGAAAQTDDRIQGRVVNPSDAPLSRVLVTLRDSTGDDTPTVTSPDGRFLLGGLDPGTYDLTVEAPGFTPFRTRITLPRPKPEDLLIRLQFATAKPAPTPAPPPPTTKPAAPPAAPTTKPVPPPPTAKPVAPPVTPATPPATPPAKPVPVAPPVAAPQAPPTPPPVRPTGPITTGNAEFVPIPDRWRLEFPQWQRYPEDSETPFVRNRGLDPYDQNVLKGDLPIAGENLFLNLTFVSETPFEFRKVPTPTGFSTERAGSENDLFFGEGEQYSVGPTGVFSFELFHGSTAFKPRDWAIRITPVFNLNYVSTKERGGLNISPAQPSTRRRMMLAIQEAFAEYKIADIGENYDFISVRAGLQPFNSDFRGFLFRDTNFGVRAFGNWGRNRNQWNLAYFDQIEKETNSDLNLFGFTRPKEASLKFDGLVKDFRKQRVFIANFFHQDFLTPGYTISPSFHANLDDGQEFFYDENGFLARPSPVGLIRPHSVKAYYAGIGGDGHIGVLNLTHQIYAAFGTDELNGIAGKETKINAQFGAIELSIDRNWWRPRISLVFASGDKDPDDDKAQGFDAIVDNPNFAGGPFSFWVRQGLRLPTTGVALVGRSSFLPSLRSSKSEGQANFVNPGLLLANVGVDAELTTKMRLTTNFSALRFHRTDVLRRLLFQDNVDAAIGYDGSVGIQYRPWLNDNVVVTTGASVFKPASGFKQIFADGILYTPFVVLTLTY